VIEGDDAPGKAGDLARDGVWGTAEGPAHGSQAHAGGEIGQKTAVVEGDFREVVDAEGLGTETAAAVGALVALNPGTVPG